MYDTSENYKDNANLSVSPVRITGIMHMRLSPVRITGMMHVNLCHRWRFQIWWTSICVKGEDVTGENYSYVECLPLSPVKATGCVCCLICSQLLSFAPFCVFPSPCSVSFCLFVCLFVCLFSPSPSRRPAPYPLLRIMMDKCYWFVHRPPQPFFFFFFVFVFPFMLLLNLNVTCA